MNANEFFEKYCADLDKEILNKKIYIENVKELKKYIKQLIIPMLNCTFLDNKYLVFNNGSIFKIDIM